MDEPLELRRPPIVDAPPPPREAKRPLKAIALLPSMATLGNLLCGVLAIVCALFSIRGDYVRTPANAHLAEFFPSFIAVGCYLIVLAMVFDALDGRLARMARQTSEFGAQLDSIADIVSFGAAPIVLFFALLLRLGHPAYGPDLVGKLEWRLALLAGLVYASCAAIRLARYNAENTKDESAQRKFSGLPVPGAAAGVIALLLFHEDLAREAAFGAEATASIVVRATISASIMLLGVLMVSRVPYTHVFNEYVRRENPPTHLVALLILVGGLGVWWPQLLLVVLAAIYIISGLALAIQRRRRDAAAVPAEEN